MVPSPSCLHDERLTLIFGPQTLDFDEALATELRLMLLTTPSLEWSVDAMLQLPHHWESVSRTLPVLKKFPGLQHMEALSTWLRVGEFPEGSFPLPNMVLTPLVVISHLAQYSTFLDLLHPKASQRYHPQLPFRHRAETLGLCTGLLSSAAVSCSVNRAQLEAYGAVAIRLAMAIGAFVDAQDMEADPEGAWKSVSIGWNSKEVVNEMGRILNEFPEAYVSVLSEERRATITAPRKIAPSLLKKLKDTGLTVADIALRGAFHCERHRSEVESLIQFFDSDPAFQFLDASQLVFPVRANTREGYLTSGKVHHEVTRSMLADQSNWHETFTAMEASEMGSRSLVVSFGRERCIPQWLRRRLGPRLMQVSDLGLKWHQLSTRIAPLVESMRCETGTVANEAIAVVGMSCRLPGANDLEDFWEALCAGKSQHTKVPADRFDFQTSWRDHDPRKQWFGNFIEDHDTFDHKFFEKSPREASSTDPQHRLMLQAAYQAVEQSGYFNMPSSDKHIGCYIGVGLVDYENNVACYPATAYTATGNLKSFVAGKISHYFGWTGPGLTIDTACSSSAVAIHQACRAVLTGECSAALAGGVNVMTSPEWFQNLAGASFLSPTGQCKPFDVHADGYCRGEGVGAVFLKKLSTALKDGNHILGVIAASGVYQNENCTAITVPNARSLSDLFSTVTRRAGLEPGQISVVEAHGTGTQVGDPAEYESVRKVFGGPERTDLLSLGSVKGLVGHTESASGIVALIKVLLMILKGAIPPQASFQSINPAVKATPSDKIEIYKELREWNVAFRAALINNYGASGSNASLVVTQVPASKADHAVDGTSLEKHGLKCPFWLCGHDDQSLRRYCAKLLGFVRSRSKPNQRVNLSNLSFQLSRQSNRMLSRALIFSCSSMAELEEKLTTFANGHSDLPSKPREQSPRPVVLCFGGQISTVIGLDRELYERVHLFRGHLDQCNEICLSLGLESFYPAIFDKAPARDIVKLQTMLFAVQYSCAKSWIDCGVEVAAAVGHSFGELTAMCISGVLSLKDTLKMIARRARIIQENWGPERGAMMAVEADEEDVERLLSEMRIANPEETAATIACFNGPRSFTLAGSAKAIESIRETITSTRAFASIKMKKLDVTHAFHSTLVEPLLSDLAKVGQDLVFRDPVFPYERATKDETTAKLIPGFAATHMRSPVYFNHAVQRLSQRYPSAIWLEAGSNSTITNMASRALGSPKSSHFQSVNLSNNSGMNSLADATTNLWKEGLSVSFWAHHPVQISDYCPLMLPPYQFEKSRHWMELKKPPKMVADEPERRSASEPQKGLWTLVQHQDRAARFRVNTLTDKYQTYVSSHIIAQTAPICPSTFQLAIAIEALATLVPDAKGSILQPKLQGMDSHAPMVMDESRCIWLDAEHSKNDNLIWDWKMISTSADDTTRDAIVHASGRIDFNRSDDATYQKEFARYERLVDRQRCLALLDGNTADGVIQGNRNIYKAFAETVQYKHELYRGLQKLAGNNNESAGRITAEHRGETLLDLGLVDAFCQVAGIFLNCMTDLQEGDMYISDRIDQWIPAPGVWSESRPKLWEVFARHYRPSDKECISDVFVFDPISNKLMDVILGIHYVKVPRARMAKLLAKLATGSTISKPASKHASVESPITNGIRHEIIHKAVAPASPPAPKEEKKAKKESQRPDVSSRVRELLCNLLGLEPLDIKPNMDLVDLGIDSLMAMEVTREIENLFKITLDLSDVVELTDFQSLVKCIQKTLGPANGSITDDEQGEADEEAAARYSTVNGVLPLTNGVTTHVNGVNGDYSHTNGHAPHSIAEESIPASVILTTFTATKHMTDRFIEESHFSKYANHVLPKSNELCIVHIADAFDQLGCSLRNARPSESLNRIKYLPKHEQFVTFLYDLLESARLVDLNGSKITRTSVPVPTKSAETLLQELLHDYPDHTYDHRLTYLTGCRLADCLTGNADGIQLIFSDPKGKEIVSGMYGQSPINVAWIQQMLHFLEQLFRNLPKQSGPINILEMGAGTGGTTARLVPLLASLGVPFQYTVTDISSSLVAGARKRFKGYPFMQFKALDIEKTPPAELLHSQHLVIATNCVHATHNLARSTKNIHDLLRPDGFLMMLEMTETIPWIDLVFGLLEGWWLFDDGRKHALAPPEAWEMTLKASGYGHVDWTDGNLPEASIQRIIIALASGPSYKRVPTPPMPLPNHTADFAARQAVVDSFVEKHTRGFSVPISPLSDDRPANPGQCVLITGATGSLGSHLVAYFASQPSIHRVICLNRYSSVECTARQQRALESRGLTLSSEALAKLQVLETDSSKLKLGLSDIEYAKISNTVTHIVHNAWPMSVTRPVKAFQSQFQTMQNLIELACSASNRRPPHAPRIGFQFISSIATVGYHPLLSGKCLVPEERMTVDSVLPSGYGEAKLVCERMLDETLHKYPDQFRPMAVRIGQIAGSKTSGYWNPVEHFAFMLKSSQTLKALPDFSGELSWCPVNDVAAILGELVLGDTTPYPIYHIENPARQSWRDMIRLLAEALDIPRANVIPFDVWLQRVREFPPSLAASENPAAMLVDFLDTHFVRMSCGGLILDTLHAAEHSKTLRNLRPVTDELVMKYVDTWSTMGFLHK